MCARLGQAELRHQHAPESPGGSVKTQVSKPHTHSFGVSRSWAGPENVHFYPALGLIPILLAQDHSLRTTE